ncbi:MAG: hypothetical protein ACKVE4_08435, partial [Dissulfuribacterales bacterium]
MDVNHLRPLTNKTDGFVKSFVCKVRKPGKGEAYFSYVEPFHGEAQRSRRTSKEVVLSIRYNLLKNMTILI